MQSKTYGLLVVLLAWGILMGQADAGVMSDMLQAMKSGRVEEVRGMLEQHPDLIKVRTRDGLTLLFYAVGLDHPDLVALLLEKGADRESRSAKGYTPLHWAAAKNAGKAAEILIRSGANGTAQDENGSTPLQLAVLRQSDRVILALSDKTSASYTDQFLDAYYAAGRAAIEKGKLEEAYETFSRLLREQPENEQVNFAYGLTCYSLQKYSLAQLAFERVLQINPGNDRARLELALCCLATRQFAVARKEFETVLAHNPPEEVRREIEVGLEEIRKQTKRWRFGGRLEGGWLDGDNVNVGPDATVIKIAPIMIGSEILNTLTIDEKSQPMATAGWFGSAALSATYDAGVEGEWLVNSVGSWYENWLDEETARENRFYQAQLGLRRIGKTSMLQLPLKFADISVESESLMSLYGISPTWLKIGGENGEWQFTGTGSAEKRDYDNLSDRNGTFLSVGGTLNQYFGKARHTVLLGLSLSQDDTDSKVYSYTGKAWTIGGEVNTPWKGTAYSQIRYIVADYKEKETLALDLRSDTQDAWVFGYRQMLRRSWGADINHQITDNDSTVALYQYERAITTISTFYTF